jgi:hypothetical protein
MNFLRRRVFMAYGLLLVLLGMGPGSWAGEKIFPPTRRSPEAISGSLADDLKAPILIAHVLLVAFVVVLHLLPRENKLLDEWPRNWLMFTYGAYAIGLVLGVVVATIMR